MQNHYKYYKIIILVFLSLQAKIAFAAGGVTISSDSIPPRTVFMNCMNTMMDDMEGQSSTVSPEVDFLQQMVSHHGGAIEMAEYEIAHGRNVEMVQLAKSILQEQTVEVNMMTRWLNSSSLPNTGLPPHYQNAVKMTMSTMMDSMMGGNTIDGCDYDFAEIMIPHHQAAIDMAKLMLTYSSNTLVISFAKKLISDEQIEIEQMSFFIK